MPYLGYSDDAGESVGIFSYEKASQLLKQSEAIYKLRERGYTVIPLIEEFIDLDSLKRLEIRLILVKFLRIHTWIKKWLQGVDFSRYTLKQSGYLPLPLEEKQCLLK